MENTREIIRTNKALDKFKKSINKIEIPNNRKELINEKNKIKILEDENNDLKNKINKLTQDYNNIIKKYEDEIKNYISMIKTLENNIEKLSLENNNLKNQINSRNNKNSNDEMLSLFKRIDDLSKNINRFPFILEKGEKILSIIFTSVDGKINYSMVCKNTDTINRLEPQLYKQYPEFSESENCFLCKGTIMNKFKKFKDLNIKNGDVIVLNKTEDSMY